MQETIEFANLVKRVSAAIKTLPRRAAVQAVNFSKERFRAQNWVDNNTTPWPKRSRSGWGKRERKGRAVLVDSGRLRRSIRVIHVDENSATIGTDVPYAKAHNNGYRGSVKQEVRAYSYPRTGLIKRGTGKLTKSGRERMKTVRVETGRVNVSGYSRTIRQKLPRRRFIGPSAVLDKQIERMMTAEISRAIKNK